MFDIEKFKKLKEDQGEKEIIANGKTLDEILDLSMSSADDALERYNELKEEKEKVEDYCKLKMNEYKKRIEEYKKEMLGNLEEEMNELELMLEHFYKKNNDKGKRIKLINGSIGYRKAPDKIVYKDTKVAVDKIYEVNPDLIRVKLEPEKNKIKKEAEIIDGEVYINNKKIEGLEFEEGKDQFNIR